MLEEPAYAVYLGIAAGETPTEIIQTCRKKYGHLEENIPQFVEEVTEIIYYYNDPGTRITIAVPEPEGFAVPADETLEFVTYRIGETILRVGYPSEWLKQAVHLTIAHLEVPESGNTTQVIRCAEHNDTLCFYDGQTFTDAFKREDLHYFTGCIRQLMYSKVFGREYTSWMMALHASGVTCHGEALIFSAAGGSGKSTLSAILKAEGWTYLSDDFIMAGENGRVFPFPAAVSVKPGAFEALSAYYPELHETEQQVTRNGRTVKYLPVEMHPGHDGTGFPIRAFVFVQYAPGEPFVAEEISKKEALRDLLVETWVNPDPENIRSFFAWVSGTRFYRLRYSENSQVITFVKQLCNHE